MRQAFQGNTAGVVRMRLLSASMVTDVPLTSGFRRFQVLLNGARISFTFAMTTKGT
jgi:hypothetical protein